MACSGSAAGEVFLFETMTPATAHTKTAATNIMLLVFTVFISLSISFFSSPLNQAHDYGRALSSDTRLTFGRTQDMP